MKVKICGITNLEDALKAVEFGCDALGFVFTRTGLKNPEKRYIEPEEVLEIVQTIPPILPLT